MMEPAGANSTDKDLGLGLSELLAANTHGNTVLLGENHLERHNPHNWVQQPLHRCE